MTKCCIRGCSSDSRKKHEGLSFFRFPRNENLKRLWHDSIGAENIKPVSVLRICSIHFEKNCINRTLEVVRLKDDVLPTLFPPNTSKSYPGTSEELLSVKPFTASNMPVCTNMIMDIDAINMQQSQTTNMDVDVPVNSKKSSSVLANKTATKIQRLYSQLKLQQKKIKVLSQKCRRLKQKVFNFQNVIDELKKKNFVVQEDAILLEECAGFPEFISRQILKHRGETCPRAYGEDIRKFALTLNFLSPKAYRFVRKTYNNCLPHPRTIKKMAPICRRKSRFYC